MYFDLHTFSWLYHNPKICRNKARDILKLKNNKTILDNLLQLKDCIRKGKYNSTNLEFPMIMLKTTTKKTTKKTTSQHIKLIFETCMCISWFQMGGKEKHMTESRNSPVLAQLMLLCQNPLVFALR